MTTAALIAVSQEAAQSLEELAQRMGFDGSAVPGGSPAGDMLEALADGSLLLSWSPEDDEPLPLLSDEEVTDLQGNPQPNPYKHGYKPLSLDPAWADKPSPYDDSNPKGGFGLPE